ncbi:MAG: hypothetical protein AAFZ18_22795, partial [Myxococcota bacterium]
VELLRVDADRSPLALGDGLDPVDELFIDLQGVEMALERAAQKEAAGRLAFAGLQLIKGRPKPETVTPGDREEKAADK